MYERGQIGEDNEAESNARVPNRDPDMRVTAIANWFGSSRMVARRIGPEVSGRALVVIPFAGGCSELPYIGASKILCSDRHRHVMNLASVMASNQLGPQLYRRLRRELFHPDTVLLAQARCKLRDAASGTPTGLSASDSLDWASDYAICTWMGRGGKSGRRGEFNGALPIRYSPTGGGSGQRFHGWVSSIPAWRRVFRRCEFTTDDAFDVLDKCHDSERCAIYSDSPWPDAGNGYVYPFTESHQRRLAKKLSGFRKTRVVVRFADHPLIRELYPSDHWTWLDYPSRSQTNDEFTEVLLINREARDHK